MGNTENRTQVLDGLVDHVVGLVEFYQKKVRKGNLSASEAANYLNCLKTLGVKDQVDDAKKPSDDQRMRDILDNVPFPIPTPDIEQQGREAFLDQEYIQQDYSNHT